MMTADKTDGGAVPPTTHFAIRACCLICGHAGIDMENKTFSKPAMCTRAIDNHCDDFTMRDFGYPVRKVEVK